MDFFTVPTLTFGVVLLFLIGHDRRKILHFNVTRNPTALWVVSNSESMGLQTAAQILAIDRDAKFGAEVLSAVRGMGSEPLSRPFAVRGRTALLSAGGEVADAICWTM